MKSTVPISEDVRTLLATLLDSEYKKERAVLITRNANVSEQTRDAILAELTKIGEHDSMTVTLTDALAVEGMDEYIESVKREAVDEATGQVTDLTAKLDEANTNIQSLTDENEQLKETAQKVEEFAAKDRESKISTIVDLSLALRKPEINLESVEDSVKAFAEKLAAIEDESELDEKLNALRSDLRAAFSNTPTEGVTDPTQHTGGDSDNTDSGKEDSIVITDMASLLAKLGKSTSKK